MKTNTLIILTAILLLVPRVCFAGYACSQEGFSLDRSDREGLHLHGIINTPVPGYTFELDPDDGDSSPSVMQLTLNMTAPGGEAIEKETPLAIDADIDTKGDDVKIVNIDIVKEFESGPIKISCRSKDAEKEPVTE